MKRVFWIGAVVMVGGLGMRAEADPSIRIYPSTVSAGSVARFIIRDVQNPLSGQIEGLGRPTPLIVLPDNSLTAQVVIPTTSQTSIGVVVRIRNTDNQRQAYPMRIAMGVAPTLPPVLTKLNQQVSELEADVKQTNQRLSAAPPSQLPRLQLKLDDAKRKIAQLLQNWNEASETPPSEPSKSQNDARDLDTEQREFDRDEDAYNARMTTLDLLIATRGKNDPAVIKESQALRELDLALSKRESSLTLRQSRISNSTHPSPSSTVASNQPSPTPSHQDLENANTGVALAQLNAEMRALIEMTPALLEPIRSKESTVADLKRKIAELKSTFTVEETLITELHNDSIQRQAEYVKKQDELALLSKELDSKKNQLSKIKGAKLAEFQIKQSDILQLTQMIQNKKNVLRTLMSIMRKMDSELLEKKAEFSRQESSIQPLETALRVATDELDSGYNTLESHSVSVTDLLNRIADAKRQNTGKPTIQRQLNAMIDPLHRVQNELWAVLPESKQSHSPALSTSLFSVPHILLGIFSGYRQFESTSPLSSGPLLGIRSGYDWGTGWGARLDGWLVSSMMTHRNKWVGFGSVIVTKQWMSVWDGDVYGIAGVSIGESPRDSISPELGMGIKWNWIENIMGSIEVSGFKEWGIQLGVHRLLAWSDQTREEFNQKQLPPPRIGINVTNKKRVFTFPIITLSHLNQHWGKIDIERMMRLGILSYQDSPRINPNRELTRLEAARMIAFAQNIPDLLKKDPVTIKIEIESKSKTPPLIEIGAFDQKNRGVSPVLPLTEMKAGVHIINWDTAIVTPITSPISSLRLEVSAKTQSGEVISVESRDIPIIIHENFDEIFTQDASNNTSRTQSDLLSNWDGITRLSGDGGKDTPDSMVTRLSFAIAVSHIIESIRGKIGHTPVDLSTYRDASEFPIEAIDKLSLYISELEYGGDSNKKFRPYSNITVAEASRIINRLLNWQETRTGVAIPK